MTTKTIGAVESLHSPQEAPELPRGGGFARPRPSADEFRAIYQEHYPVIWRFLVNLGVRKSDVPDVTHNVFLIAYRKLPTFEQRSSLRTWLLGIALRAARDFRKSAAVRREVSSDDPDGEHTERAAQGLDSEAELTQKRQLALAERLLDELSPEQRDVFVLHELEQLTGDEIAELLQAPVGTIRSRLRRARAFFRKRLAEQRQDEPDV